MAETAMNTSIFQNLQALLQLQVNDSNSTQFHQIEYHPGLSTYFGFRWQFVRTGNEDRYYPYFTPITVGTSALPTVQKCRHQFI